MDTAPASAAQPPPGIPAPDIALDEETNLAFTVPLFRIGGVTARAPVPLLVFTFALSAASAGGHDGAGVLFFPTVLSCLAVHEVGHALAARLLGYRVGVVVLHLFRTSLAMGRVEKPAHQAIIAAAGPGANLIFAALLVLIAAASGLLSPVTSLTSLSRLAQGLSHSGGNPLMHAAALHLFLAIISLLPAFPFDGGFLAKAALTPRFGKDHALFFTVTLSRLCALGLAVAAFRGAGLFCSLLSFLSLFASGQEANRAALTNLMRRLTVKDCMEGNVVALSPGDRLQTAFPFPASHFPVVLGKEPIGVLSRTALLRQSGRSGGAGGYVSGAMSRVVTIVAPDDPLSGAIALSPDGMNTPLIVRENGVIVGLMTANGVRRRLAGMGKEPTIISEDVHVGTR